MTTSTIRLAVLLPLAALAACGGGAAPTDPAGGTAPTATLSLVGGSLPPGQVLVVGFSSSMSRGSLVVGGTLAASLAPATWSTTAAPDDTVTLAPLGGWPAGQQTLTVNAADLDGRALAAPLLATYQVLSDACGAPGGACVDDTDCAFTMAQLGATTQACTASHAGNLPAISACVHGTGPTLACSDCAAGYGTCAATSCLQACAGGFASAGCVTCLAGTSGCTVAFVACSGRTP